MVRKHMAQDTKFLNKLNILSHICHLKWYCSFILKLWRTKKNIVGHRCSRHWMKIKISLCWSKSVSGLLSIRDTIENVWSHLVLVLDVGEVVKHPTGASSKVAVRTDELRENDADQKLFELVLVIFLLQENISHRADHVQCAILLRRGCVGVLKSYRSNELVTTR